MKKIIVACTLILSLSGLSFASGFDFHFGVGYHSSYFSTVDDLAGVAENVTEAATIMPLGIGGYAGIGIGFGDSQIFNLGIEFAPSWDFNLSSFALTNLALQMRTYFKIVPVKAFTISLLLGYNVNLTGSFEDDPLDFLGTSIMGLRVTLKFLYLEYATNFRTDFSGLAKHEIGLGIAIFR